MKSKKLIKTVRDLVEEADSKLSTAEYIMEHTEDAPNSFEQSRIDGLIMQAETLLHTALGICILLKGRNSAS